MLNKNNKKETKTGTKYMWDVFFGEYYGAIGEHCRDDAMTIGEIIDELKCLDEDGTIVFRHWQTHGSLASPVIASQIEEVWDENEHWNEDEDDWDDAYYEDAPTMYTWYPCFDDYYGTDGERSRERCQTISELVEDLEELNPEANLVIKLSQYRCSLAAPASTYDIEEIESEEEDDEDWQENF